MADKGESRYLWIFYIKSSDGDLRAAFKIDGRSYADPADARRDALEAHRALDERMIVGESEVSRIGPGEPAPDIPTWQLYKCRLPPME